MAGNARNRNGDTITGMSSPSPLKSCMRMAATAIIPVTIARTAKLLKSFPIM